MSEYKELDEVSIARAKKEFDSFLSRNGIPKNLSAKETMEEIVSAIGSGKCCGGKFTGHGISYKL